MGERAPYSRIYWTVRADDRLASIYPDDRHLAAWVRLLIAADMAWPAPADLPGSVRRASLAALEAAGAIELLSGGLFRFHGLDTERGRRADAARNRTVPDRGPSGDPLVPKRSSSRDETSRDETETSRDETHAGSNGYPTDGDYDAQDRYYQLTGYRPWGIWSGEKLLAAERDYGRAETIAALDAEWTSAPDKKTILDRMLARLARDADKRREEAKAKPRPIRKTADQVEAEYVESRRVLAGIMDGSIPVVKEM